MIVWHKWPVVAMFFVVLLQKVHYFFTGYIKREEILFPLNYRIQHVSNYFYQLFNVYEPVSPH